MELQSKDEKYEELQWLLRNCVKKDKLNQLNEEIQRGIHEIRSQSERLEQQIRNGDKSDKIKEHEETMNFFRMGLEDLKIQLNDMKEQNENLQKKLNDVEKMKAKPENHNKAMPEN